MYLTEFEESLERNIGSILQFYKDCEHSRWSSWAIGNHLQGQTKEKEKEKDTGGHTHCKGWRHTSTVEEDVGAKWQEKALFGL